MQVADDSSVDQWRARYFAGADTVQLELDPDVDAQLTELALLVGQPKTWLLSRVLFAHAHGRLRLERMNPGHAAGAYLRPAGVSVALLEDLAGLARRENSVQGTYVHDALVAELGGVLGAEAVGVDDDNAWAKDDASLKVWLPDKLDSGVKELAECWEVTASDVLRNLLLTHLYGRLGYQRALQRGVWAACRRQPDLDWEIMFSARQQDPGEEPVVAPRTQFVRLHGKSESSVRLWCPTAMKVALSAQAAHRASSLSEYVRLAILEAVFGKNYTR